MTAHKVALITGASTGIGRATATLLAANNYDLVLLARSLDDLRKVEQELGKYKIKAIVRECDVTKVLQVHNAVESAKKEFGKLDVLITCAGFGVYGDFESMSLNDINTQMLTNYYGTVLCIKECLPLLKESKGSIVTVASIAGLSGVPRLTAYSASKHAVVGLSQSLLYELEPSGVAVSCVCPGKVKTDFFAHESFKDVGWAHSESGLSPHDVAETILVALHERHFLYVLPKKSKWNLFLKDVVPKFITKKVMKKV